jgi:hypothetical protein
MSGKATSPASNSYATSDTKAKNRKRRKIKQTKSQPDAVGTSPTTNEGEQQNERKTGKYPYPTDYNDHFETPQRAYEDILPIIGYVLKKKINRYNSQSDVTIYDPYFCTGRAATLLNATFEQHTTGNKRHTNIRIQHEKRDFYQDVRQNNTPQYDILVTNPPYSGDHKERCLEYVVDQLKNNQRPFFLLMPNYVASKEYFRKIVLEEKIQVVFITPSSKHPYEYDHPEGTGHETSPFASVWFCGLSCGDTDGTWKKNVRSTFDKFHTTKTNNNSSFDTPRIAMSLQELIGIGGLSGEKRKNPRQRKKMRQQATQKTINQAVGNNIQKNSDNSNSHQSFHGKRKESGSGGGGGGAKTKRRF